MLLPLSCKHIFMPKKLHGVRKWLLRLIRLLWFPTKSSWLSKCRNGMSVGGAFSMVASSCLTPKSKQSSWNCLLRTASPGMRNDSSSSQICRAAGHHWSNTNWSTVQVCSIFRMFDMFANLLFCLGMYLHLLCKFFSLCMCLPSSILRKCMILVGISNALLRMTSFLIMHLLICEQNLAHKIWFGEDATLKPFPWHPICSLEGIVVDSSSAGY